jgi:thiamine-monophosphate kinase
MGAGDEFSEIARLFRPLTRGVPGAFDLKDDAAVVSQRPGCDLVVTKDAIVAGVHFPTGERPDLIARKLLRVNLSDLAAKAAEPFGCFLAVAWPKDFAASDRESFAFGLGEDLAGFGVALLGGDTVVTPGPFTASLTALGWVPEGRMVRRDGARPGDRIAVSGTIGDAVLGLAAAQGELDDPNGALTARYRLPNPRLDLRETMRSTASAAADVSDGLVADTAHIADASGTGIRLELEAMPLSAPARQWLERQPDRELALLRLATSGDDYEVVAAFQHAPRPGFTVCGEIVAGSDIDVRIQGRRVEVVQRGWRHL